MGFFQIGVVLTGVALVLISGTARATPPAPELLARLAAHAAGVDAMRTRASYALDGRMERLDGDGKPDQVKELHARMDADGKRAQLVVLKYFEDGADKTDEGQKKARERNAESDEDREKKQLRMPFLTSEQRKYRFEQLEVDAKDSARVRIGFVPTAPDEHTVEGSAWVDARRGTVLTAGFKVSKTSMWVDYVHITVEFGAETPLGPALSKVTMEGKGGVLFFRKRFRAVGTLSDYRIAP